MNTQDQIQAIIAIRYGNYTSNHGRRMKIIHNHLRSLETPLKWYEYLYVFFGGKITPKKYLSDEQFLEYLQKLETLNPKPSYQISNYNPTYREEDNLNQVT